jgi:hypothetical protein
MEILMFGSGFGLGVLAVILWANHEILSHLNKHE